MRNYEALSREELMEIIGTDMDADTSRDELVAMAKEKDMMDDMT